MIYCYLLLTILMCFLLIILIIMLRILSCFSYFPVLIFILHFLLMTKGGVDIVLRLRALLILILFKIELGESASHLLVFNF